MGDSSEEGEGGNDCEGDIFEMSYADGDNGIDPTESLNFLRKQQLASMVKRERVQLEETGAEGGKVEMEEDEEGDRIDELRSEQVTIE